VRQTDSRWRPRWPPRLRVYVEKNTQSFPVTQSNIDRFPEFFTGDFQTETFSALFDRVSDGDRFRPERGREVEDPRAGADVDAALVAEQVGEDSQTQLGAGARRAVVEQRSVGDLVQVEPRILALQLVQPLHHIVVVVNNNNTRLTALFRDYPGEPVPERYKPIWILLKHEIVSGSGICWAIYKSAPRYRLISMPTPHHSVFYRPDALPVAQLTASKH